MKKKIEMDPGNPSAQYGEAARSPGRKPNRYALFSPCLADVWAPLARATSPSSTSSRFFRRWPSPSSNSLPPSIPFTAYLIRRLDHAYN
jgi:hypothetical protein